VKKSSLVLLICGILWLLADPAGAQYLVPGLGVEGSIKIGEHKAGAKATDWNSTNQGLDYRVDEKGIVILIRCQDPRYVTDRNIRIGSPETDLIRWYGAAREREVVPEGVVYGYVGISFAVKGGQVVAIYIFPRYLLKK